MGKKYDVSAAIETYKDRQGNEKVRWLNIGSIIETKDGKYKLKLECVPIGWNGWAGLYEPKQREEKPMADDKIPDLDLPKRDFDDDVPF